MLLLRKFLFLILLLAYVIVCPLLILYALGYIYNPVKQELVPTGILQLTTIPSGADIYLEKSRFSHNTPTAIKELLPGSYKVTLRKKGYRPWTHSITIEAGKVAAFRNILLIPENWPQESITTHGCKDLIDIENEKLFIVTTGSSMDGFFVYNVDGKIRPLLSFRSPFFTSPVSKVLYEAQSNVIIVYASQAGGKKYLCLNLDDKKTDATDITKLISPQPSFIAWQKQKEPLLFACRKSCIDLVSVAEETTYPCWLADIKGFGVYNEGVYVIDANDSLVYHTPGMHRQKNLSEDMNLPNRLFSRSDFYRIETEDGETFFFLGSQGDFIVNLPPYYIAAQDVIGYRLGNNSGLVLYWTKTSLSLADFSAGTDKTGLNENFRVRTLYENGRNIKQVFWLDDRSHILCSDADSIYLIELLPQGAPHVEFVTGIKDNTKVFYDSTENTLYYLDDKNGVLKQLQIISKLPITISPSAE